MKGLNRASGFKKIDRCDKIGLDLLLSQNGSTLILLSFLLSILTSVGIFYGLSQAIDFNILGNERRMMVADAAVEFALDEIVAYFDTQLESLPENVKDNRAKSSLGKFLYKDVAAPVGSKFNSVFQNYQYRFNIDYIRTISSVGESVNRTRTLVYEITVDLYDAKSSQIVRNGSAQYTRLVSVREGSYYDDQVKK